ncbi:MAG: hypothetical protein US39_C0016G0050 [Microgenomates group bacterium GW2011_GWC1_37_12b]|uniref:DUF5660 domain-containing protein n=1 Tax=Candidatus Woesebacteria bacterium GW2011_GWB1_38_8b TaxID=1618571 RepID=A0A0G0LF22_9BACT|nr:MAG: hypothetical protein US39_C0016G0050 [Microgenomates group bacterium GW2011_GWC1_37_12b]KKQ86545.1 MAG: hypothetical protein UT10_C0022G0006 [Candidatus Woesebacteria bacterium GW2011_GWB1_38_8b]
MAKSNNKAKVFGNIPNPLEALNNIGKDTVGQLTNEAGNIATDFVDQLFGINIKGASGEIRPGGSVSMKEIMEAKASGKAEAKKEVFFERTLIEQEKVMVEKRSNELKMQLKVLQEELIITSSRVGKFAKETQIAAMQATVEPGMYHVIFFQKLLEYIKSFKTKIESATNWLHSSNKRAAKKNAWGNNYKKHGAKYLLSEEHYVARSSG